MKFTNSTKMKSFTIHAVHLRKAKSAKRITIPKENVSEKEAKSIDLLIEEMSKVVMDFQTNFTSNNPDILFSKILNATKDVEMPQFPFLGDGTEDKDLQFRYYKSHFLTPLIFLMKDY